MPYHPRTPLGPRSTPRSVPAHTGPSKVDPPPPPPIRSSLPTALLVTAVIIGALAAVGAVVWLTYVKPRSEFSPQVHKHSYSRDALDAKVPEVNLEGIFSPNRINDYRRGSGFELTLRVLNDPRNNYNVSTKVCALESWSRFAQTSNPKRRELVASKQQEVDDCVKWFRESLGITRTVEIALDDTEGVTESYRQFVKNRLDGLERELASTTDTVRLFVFRLTDEDYLDYQRVEFKPDTSEVDVKDELDRKLDWLVAPRKPAQQSSIATGLFNALNLNRDVRKRKVIVFTDGMENSVRTTTFYPAVRNPAFFDETHWQRLDERISQQMNCPDLSRTEVTWYAPQVPGAHIRAAQNYWRHVLVDTCKVPADKVEMVY